MVRFSWGKIAVGFLYIKRLRVESLVGTLAWEQTQRQPLYVSLECQADIVKAALHDKIADALDYQRLADEITQLVTESHFQLIESVAKCIKDYLKERYGISQGSVEVAKPQALDEAAEVGVVLKF